MAADEAEIRNGGKHQSMSYKRMREIEKILKAESRRNLEASARSGSGRE
jgi:hypothetical protein